MSIGVSGSPLLEGFLESAKGDALLPSVRARCLLTCLAVDAALIVGAVYAATMSHHSPDVHFSEGRFVTWVSAMQLFAVGVMSMWIFVLRHRRAADRSLRSPHWLWLLMALGLALLAVDEAIALHEWIDHRIHAAMAWSENPWTDRIDDLIVLAYGVAAIAALAIYRAELAPFRLVRSLLGIGFALFFVMVGLDLLTNSWSIAPERLPSRAQLEVLAAWAHVAEESTKLFSEAAFLAAFAVMLHLARRRRSTPAATETAST